ncbi:MAG: restriction endonuclease subunit S [Microthrixaceae bacterium]
MTQLPSGWTEVTLGDVCEIVSGATPKTSVESYWGGPIRWATPKDLSDLGARRYLIDTPRTLTEDGLRSCGARILPAGSVLFSSRAPVGLTAINRVPVATNQGFKSLVPSPNVDAEYLYWWLSANRRRMEHLGRGATFKEVSKAIVAEVSIPLPPLEEQRRIAAILDKADELRAKRRAALEQLDSLTQAVFLGVQANHPDTPCVTIESIAARERGSIRTGPFGSQLLHSEFVNEGVRVLGIDNVVANEFRWAEPRYITHEKYETLRRFTVHPGDVLVTIMGTCGRAAVVPDDVPVAINTKHLCCITVDRAVAEPRWLHAALLHDRMTRRQLGERAKGAVMPGLNMGVIKSTEVPIPRLVVQQEFVAQLEAIDRLKLRSAATGLGGAALFASLQARAFRGEL